MFVWGVGWGFVVGFGFFLRILPSAFKFNILSFHCFLFKVKLYEGLVQKSSKVEEEWWQFCHFICVLTGLGFFRTWPEL